MNAFITVTKTVKSDEGFAETIKSVHDSLESMPTAGPNVKVSLISLIIRLILFCLFRINRLGAMQRSSQWAHYTPPQPK